MQIGDYRVEIIPDTEFRLDGGAMFGVVPRVLWERVSPPDELNRVTLNCNCLFIDTGQQKILVETGMGEKWTPREIEMYGIRRERPVADTLREIAGCASEAIDIVINTHLHFDHAGGNTVGPHAARVPTGEQASRLPAVRISRADRGPNNVNIGVDASETLALQSGHLRPQFKNARYLISRSEFEHATAPHERDRASYLDVNWLPLIDSQQLEMMPDRYEPVPGLVVEQVRGHSETMQTIKLTSGGETLFGFFDMVPTRHHLSPAWIMSYDLFPTETLEFKKRLLPRALEENWICHFYHDPEMPLCRLAEVNGKIQALPLDK
jgi:glyoxylase-like metal-dependent hydrolase (beta-lactamase superfamily II)